MSWHEAKSFPLRGIDFTSAPRRAKPIIVAEATWQDGCVRIERFRRLAAWDAFESLLEEPGPWIGAFDLPFGLPRALVQQLGWPTSWGALIDHLDTLGREAFRQALDRVRQSRPQGQRYIHRATDLPARSSSPMKLVNPPVGLMFYEGARRLRRARVSILPCAPSADPRIAVEGYPAFYARQLVKGSYKGEGPLAHDPERATKRARIVEALPQAFQRWTGCTLEWSGEQQALCRQDGSGDHLDSVLILVSATLAAQALRAGDPHAGVPASCDALEGWIAGVACSDGPRRAQGRLMPHCVIR